MVLEAVASNSGALRFSTLKSQRSFVLLAVETAGLGDHDMLLGRLGFNLWINLESVISPVCCPHYSIFSEDLDQTVWKELKSEVFAEV